MNLSVVNSCVYPVRGRNGVSTVVKSLRVLPDIIICVRFDPLDAKLEPFMFIA